MHHLFPALPLIIKEFAFGLIAGLLVVAIFTGGEKIFLLIKAAY